MLGERRLTIGQVVLMLRRADIFMGEAAIGRRIRRAAFPAPTWFGNERYWLESVITQWAAEMRRTS
ncbi:MAG: hypothetical protein F2813_00330 [Actinobacteria bacterium]|uniref:Unannotated protein n=1 Tax=freshwater metagenome TaxID=449393 RepID=A0A6J5YW67_9ZZZZ|nr:hypothetical protein [Actinomycetota bacterium]